MHSSNTDAQGDSARYGRRAPRFTPVPEWILLAGLTPQAVALYAMLLAHVNRQRDDGLAWPGLMTLAELLGFRTRKSVSRYIAELAAIGAVEVERQAGTTLRRNVYVVHEIAPASHVGEQSLTEFYAARKTPRGTPVPLGRATTVTIGTGISVPQNQTNATTRTHPDETTATGTTHAVVDDSASTGHRASAPTAMNDHERPRLKIRVPRGFYGWDDEGRVVQQLVRCALGAWTKAGMTPHSDAADAMGRTLRHNDGWADRRAMVKAVEGWINEAGTDHKNGWLADRSDEYLETWGDDAA